jgi:hypothetical protein
MGVPFALKSAAIEVEMLSPREHALLRLGFIDKRVSMCPRAVNSILRRRSIPLRTIAPLPPMVTALTRPLRPIADEVARQPESSAKDDANLVIRLATGAPILSRLMSK